MPTDADRTGRRRARHGAAGGVCPALLVGAWTFGDRASLDAAVEVTGADIPYVQAAYDMGLGEMDLDKVRVRSVKA